MNWGLLRRSIRARISGFARSMTLAVAPAPPQGAVAREGPARLPLLLYLQHDLPRQRPTQVEPTRQSHAGLLWCTAPKENSARPPLFRLRLAGARRPQRGAVRGRSAKAPVFPTTPRP